MESPQQCIKNKPTFSDSCFPSFILPSHSPLSIYLSFRPYTFTRVRLCLHICRAMQRRKGRLAKLNTNHEIRLHLESKIRRAKCTSSLPAAKIFDLIIIFARAGTHFIEISSFLERDKKKKNKKQKNAVKHDITSLYYIFRTLRLS